MEISEIQVGQQYGVECSWSVKYAKIKILAVEGHRNRGRGQRTAETVLVRFDKFDPNYGRVDPRDIVLWSFAEKFNEDIDAQQQADREKLAKWECLRKEIVSVLGVKDYDVEMDSYTEKFVVTLSSSDAERLLELLRQTK